jgi:hypothetical protein
VQFVVGVCGKMVRDILPPQLGKIRRR